MRREEWEVRGVSLSEARDLVRRYHYSKGGSNTACFTHGLFRRGMFQPCMGVAWWLPPTKACALAVYPEDWQAVLSLSRMAIAPEVPTNAASFLLAESIKLIRATRKWAMLVTFADSWQGHEGGVYRAANWIPAGQTKPERTYIDRNGKMVCRKAGPKTRTQAEMEALGCECVGTFTRRRFLYPLTTAARHRIALEVQP